MLDTLQELISGSVYYNLPSFEVALFSLLLGFVLSSTIAVTYRLTFRGKIFPSHFFQAMILSSLVTGMIMMAVGNNFAVGFGIIGAVAIIRFRTIISDPRNIIFMFAAISIGIATGVKGYSIAVAGTILFSLVSFLLYWSPFGNIQNRFRVVITSNADIDFKEILKTYAKSVSHKSKRRLSEGRIRNEFLVEVGEATKGDEIFQNLSSVDEVLDFRVDTISTSEDQL